MVNRLQHSAETKSRRNIVTLLLTSALFAIPQIYGAFRIKHYFFQHTIDEILTLPPPPRELLSSPEEEISDHRSNFPPIPQKVINETFGACLMIKDDNELIHEWLAYHYTTLPLRYVFVASDVGSLQDPEEILMRWKTANTDLIYWVQNASEFVDRHGQEYGTMNSIKDVHHAFVNSKCMDLFFTLFVTILIDAFQSHIRATGLHNDLYRVFEIEGASVGYLL